MVTRRPLIVIVALIVSFTASFGVGRITRGPDADRPSHRPALASIPLEPIRLELKPISAGSLPTAQPPAPRWSRPDPAPAPGADQDDGDQAGAHDDDGQPASTVPQPRSAPPPREPAAVPTPRSPKPDVDDSWSSSGN